MLTYSLATPPHSPTDIRLFFKKRRTHQPARRALTELGVNNISQNLKMAETICAMAAEEFKKRWDFDPVLGQPVVDSELFQWTALKSCQGGKSSPTKKDPARDLNYVVECLAGENSPEEHPSPSSISEDVGRDFDGISTDKSQARFSLGDYKEAGSLGEDFHLGKGSNSPKTPSRKQKVVVDSLTPRTKQCKITEYGRQRKRLHSLSKTEGEGEVERDGPRKRLVLSPLKTTVNKMVA